MSEIIGDKKVHSLYEFVSSVSRAIDKFYNKTYWIKAEISKLNHFPKTGHCYPELIENHDGKQLANISGFIHRDDFQKLNQKFLETTGEPIKDGMVVLIFAKVHLSTTRGLKINIYDIDINSIVGSQTMLKNLNINKLKSEGLFARNKQLKLPRLIKKLAVISVETGKGYADFMTIIKACEKFKVETTLLNTAMVGSQSVAEILSSLKAILARWKDFDAVCVVRGGGGEASLQCFNDYEIAKNIAQFPIPVMAGIGHATNDTITEQVCCKSFVSPSELANYIVKNNTDEVNGFNILIKKIADRLAVVSNFHKEKFANPTEKIKLKFNYAIKLKFNKLQQVQSNIAALEKRNFMLKQQNVELLKHKIISLVRTNFATKNQQLTEVISKVMMIVGKQNKIFADNKYVKCVKDLKQGDEFQIFMEDGVIMAHVDYIIRKG